MGAPEMDLQLVLFLAGLSVALIGCIYAAMQSEIRKLRKHAHDTANQLTSMSLALSMVCHQLGIEWKPPRRGEEEE